MAQDLDFVVGDNAKQTLISTVERIEQLEEEKASLGDDIKEAYSEAKGTGFDTRIIRQVIRLRKMDPADRKIRDELLAVYLAALS